MSALREMHLENENERLREELKRHHSVRYDEIIVDLRERAERERARAEAAEAQLVELRARYEAELAVTRGGRT